MASKKLIISNLEDTEGRKTKVRAGDSIVYSKKAGTIMLLRNTVRGNKIFVRDIQKLGRDDKVSFGTGFSEYMFVEFAQYLAACLGLALLPESEPTVPDLVRFAFARVRPMKSKR